MRILETGGILVRANRGRKWIKRLSFVLGGIAAVMVTFLQPFVHAGGMRQTQEIKRQDIRPILEKRYLREDDYKMIFSQTGVARAGTERILSREKNPDKTFIEFQEFFLEMCHVECCRENLFTMQDQRQDMGEPQPLVPLENGDILISFSSHSLGWRHGHAGLVVDAEKEKVLEAVTPGKCSEIKSMGYWRKCSEFMIFRLKNASYKKRAQIASYASEHLCGIPYSLLSGIFGEEEKGQTPLSAHCAYLIWYAFFCFGYDLDADGGMIVTVMDLAKSPQLELLQVFGMDTKEVTKTAICD